MNGKFESPLIALGFLKEVMCGGVVDFIRCVQTALSVHLFARWIYFKFSFFKIQFKGKVGAES